MRAVYVRSRHFNGGQPSGLGQYFDCGMSLLRGGICGTLRYIVVLLITEAPKEEGWVLKRAFSVSVHGEVIRHVLHILRVGPIPT